MAGVYLHLAGATFRGSGGLVHRIQPFVNGSVDSVDLRHWITDNSGEVDAGYGFYATRIHNAAVGDYFETQVLSTAPGCTPSQALLYLGPSPTACQIHHAGGVSITTGTFTVIEFTEEVYDPGGMHSTISNKSRITIPTTGDYLVIMHSSFLDLGGNASQHRLYKNGAQTTVWEPSMGYTYSDLNGIGAYSMTLEPLVAGDYLEMAIFQPSGSDKNTDLCNFTVLLIPSSDRVQAYRDATGLSGANNAFTDLTLPLETIDTNSMHSTSSLTSRVTIPTTGYYFLCGNARPAQTQNIMWLELRKNGGGSTVTRWGREKAGSNTNRMSGWWFVDATAGDYFEIWGLHDTGSDQNWDYCSLGGFRIDFDPPVYTVPGQVITRIGGRGAC